MYIIVHNTLNIRVHVECDRIKAFARKNVTSAQFVLARLNVWLGELFNVDESKMQEVLGANQLLVREPTASNLLAIDSSLLVDPAAVRQNRSKSNRNSQSFKRQRIGSG